MIGGKKGEREAQKRVELRSRRWQFAGKQADVKVKDERTGEDRSSLLNVKWKEMRRRRK